MVAGHLQEKKGIYYMVLNFVDEDGNRKTKWKSTKLPVKGNKRKAEAMLLEERKRYASSKIITRPNNEMLFADYMLYWLKYIKHEVDITTYAGYKSNVEKRIVPYFRKTRITLGELRACDIQDFYTCCMETLDVTSNTVIHYHANINTALNYAVTMDFIPTSPMKKGMRPKYIQHNSEFYSLEETARLFEAVRGDPIEFAVIAASFYGLRREEVLGLTWPSVDFYHNTITVFRTVVQVSIDGKNQIVEKDRAKNQSSYRTLPLVPQFRELLLGMRASQEANKKICGKSYFDSEYIYVNEIGVPYKPNYVTQHFALVLKKKGLRKIRYHELRHTCASLLVKNKVPMKDIQAWLGHSSYNTTANIYAHLEFASKEFTGLVMDETLNVSNAMTARRIAPVGENLL